MKREREKKENMLVWNNYSDFKEGLLFSSDFIFDNRQKKMKSEKATETRSASKCCQTSRATDIPKL